MSLTPAAPSPGTDVRLSVRGCPGTTGTAVSDAFVADARLVREGGTLTGDTRIRSSSAAGAHAVTVDCDGQEVKGVVTVAGPSASASGPAASASPSAQTSPTATAAPAASSSPTAPVQAGGGGTSNASPPTPESRHPAPGTRSSASSSRASRSPRSSPGASAGVATRSDACPDTNDPVAPGDC
ncbi:hypothetical protein ACFQ0G_31560 [Streptomyces chiangmaiensis]